jgi:hypothetical protein
MSPDHTALCGRLALVWDETADPLALDALDAIEDLADELTTAREDIARLRSALRLARFSQIKVANLASAQREAIELVLNATRTPAPAATNPCIECRLSPETDPELCASPRRLCPGGFTD